VPHFMPLLAAAFVLLSAAPLAAQSVGASRLQNGDFQEGGFGGWTVNAGYTSVLSQPYGAYQAVAGSTYAIMGPVGADGTLSQRFGDVVGAPLTVSFYLASDGGLTNDFSAGFDGQTLLALSDIPVQGWQLYSFAVVGTGSDTLAFSFRDDPGYWALDNVAVTAAAIPEPGAVVLLVAGVIALGAGRRGWRFKQQERKRFFLEKEAKTLARWDAR